MEVPRIVPLDPDEPEGGNSFGGEFELSRPNMDASVEVLASDVGDEGQVVVEALDALQDGLETWARALGRRKDAERIEPLEEGRPDTALTP